MADTWSDKEKKMMQYEIGVYGLGVMGAGIARNMLDHGVRTAVYSVSEEERKSSRRMDMRKRARYATRRRN